jgi:hypothetical protein
MAQLRNMRDPKNTGLDVVPLTCATAIDLCRRNFGAPDFAFLPEANPSPGPIAGDEAPFVGRHFAGMVRAESSSSYVGGGFGHFRYRASLRHVFLV